MEHHAPRNHPQVANLFLVLCTYQNMNRNSQIDQPSDQSLPALTINITNRDKNKTIHQAIYIFENVPCQSPKQNFLAAPRYFQTV